MSRRARGRDRSRHGDRARDRLPGGRRRRRGDPGRARTARLEETAASIDGDVWIAPCDIRDRRPWTTPSPAPRARSGLSTRSSRAAASAEGTATTTTAGTASTTSSRPTSTARTTASARRSDSSRPARRRATSSCSSSILARIAVPGYTGYSASKAGLLGLVRSFAAELAPGRRPGERDLSRLGRDRHGLERARRDRRVDRRHARRRVPRRDARVPLGACRSRRTSPAPSRGSSRRTRGASPVRRSTRTAAPGPASGHGAESSATTQPVGRATRRSRRPGRPGRPRRAPRAPAAARGTHRPRRVRRLRSIWT